MYLKKKTINCCEMIEIYKTKEKKQEIYIDKLLYSSGHSQFF